MTGPMRASAACLAALAFLGFGCRTAVRSNAGRASSGPATVEVPAAKAPEGVEVKLDGRLIAVVRAYRSGGDIAAKALVRTENVATVDDRLRVGVTVADTKDVAATRTRIGELGGEVTVEFGNRVFALLPVAALESLAAEEIVWSIAVPRQIVSPPGRR